METRIYSAADLPARVSVGYVGENAFRSLQIDVSAWLTAYPSGIVSAVYQRPDGATYPVELSQSGTVVGWRPEARDLVAAGYGKLELQIRSGQTVGKSAAVSVYIARALEAGEEPDPPSPGWLEEVLAAAATAENAADRAGEALEPPADLRTRAGDIVARQAPAERRRGIREARLGVVVRRVFRKFAEKAQRHA